MRKSEAKWVIRDAIKAIDKTEVRTSAPTMYRDEAMADAARARDILAGVSWGLSEALEALETDEDGFDVTPGVVVRTTVMFIERTLRDESEVTSR